jgi:Tfp pilus assembly protein PilW
VRVDGFSLVELTIGLALTLALTAAVFTLTQSARAASDTQSEVVDLQQRTRVAVDTMAHDLMMAGAGPYVSGYAGPLSGSIPPVMPFRRGNGGGDPPGTFRSDAITIAFVPTTAAQTTLTADVAFGSQTFILAREQVCAGGVNLCGFAPGVSVVAYDAAGSFQVFTIGATLDAASQITTTTPASTLFRSGSALVEIDMRTYSLKADAAIQATQLIRTDAATNISVPVLDHVVTLALDYDVAPPELVDGPWRPDAASANRWDADLLRIRTVGVTIRLESALAALRGPAGVLFSNGGTATNPRTWVPDQEVRFRVSPRNLSLRH